MPAYKDKKTNKWYAKFYYEDYSGNRKTKFKRGFDRKKDALDWERDFLTSQQGTPDMKFEVFWNEYKKDMSGHIKDSTWESKIGIVDTKILPYFEGVPVNEIDEHSIRKWQNWIMRLTKPNGQPYAETYIKSINNELSAILNHAVVYYKLPYNPIHRTGSIGAKHAEEMEFWTLDEFNQFIAYFEDDTLYNLVYNLLYYTGMRQGELLALTLNDFDFNDYTVTIKKTGDVEKRKNAITTTKTRSSNRVITFPKFIKEALFRYINQLYKYEPTERLFSITNKSQLNRKLKEAAQATDVKPIRVHDLRHSHVALLIDRDVSIKVIQVRLGHKKFETTFNTYGHLYPTKQQEVADLLNDIADNSNIKTNDNSSNIVSVDFKRL